MLAKRFADLALRRCTTLLGTAYLDGKASDAQPALVEYQLGRRRRLGRNGNARGTAGWGALRQGSLSCSGAWRSWTRFVDANCARLLVLQSELARLGGHGVFLYDASWSVYPRLAPRPRTLIEVHVLQGWCGSRPSTLHTRTGAGLRQRERRDAARRSRRRTVSRDRGDQRHARSAYTSPSWSMAYGPRARRRRCSTASCRGRRAAAGSRRAAPRAGGRGGRARRASRG